MPENNLIKRVYTGELKSFLWPTRNGYLRLLIGGLFFESVMVVMLYFSMPCWYDKLYNSSWYNMLADFRSQSDATFFRWNFAILIIYQITATGLIGGLLAIFQILFQWPHLKRVSRILEYTCEKGKDHV